MIFSIADSTWITLVSLVCACLAAIVANTVTSILGYMKGLDNAKAIGMVSVQGEQNGVKLDTAHTANNSRFTDMQNKIEALAAEVGQLKGEKAVMAQMASGGAMAEIAKAATSAAASLSDHGMQDHGHGPDTLHGETHPMYDSTIDPRRVDPPRTGPN